MSVLEIFTSDLGLTLWTIGLSAAMISAAGLSIYLLPWKDIELKQTHKSVKDSLSPLSADPTATGPHVVKMA